MTFRPAPRQRETAVPMRPLVDPAGWTSEGLAADGDWVYALSDTEADEIRAAVADVERRGFDILQIGRGDVTMPQFDAGLAALYDELLEGRGFVLIRGVPISDFTKAQAAVAFWIVGTRFGHALSQNGKGHMLGHVKDFGGDYADPNVRGYQTSAEMSYHSDQCDYVALMCMHPAKRGGVSHIASLVTIYNEMLRTAPELVEALIGEFYLTRHGEIPPGEPPWYKLPIFSFHEGYFSGRGAGIHVIKAQDLPGVPSFTDVQRRAFKVFQETARAGAFRDGVSSRRHSDPAQPPDGAYALCFRGLAGAGAQAPPDAAVAWRRHRPPAGTGIPREYPGCRGRGDDADSARRFVRTGVTPHRAAANFRGRPPGSAVYASGTTFSDPLPREACRSSASASS